MARPREFDPDDVLDKAVLLFWRKGYEATSVQDLVEELGVNRGTMYNTWGSKHGLFLAALDRYRDRVADRLLGGLERSRDGAASIRKFFDGLIAVATTGRDLRGCLMTNSAVEVGLRDPEAAARVRSYLEGMEAAFFHALSRAAARGELKRGHDLRKLARFLTLSAQAILATGRASPPAELLTAHVDIVIAVLGGKAVAP